MAAIDAMTVIGAMGGMDTMDAMDAMGVMDVIRVKDAMNATATIRAIETMTIEIVGRTRIRANAANPTKPLVMTIDRLAAILPFDKRPQPESAHTGLLPTHGMMIMMRIAPTINNTI